MKSFTTREFVSLAAILITAPLFAICLILGIRATVAVGDELLLLALTLCGAVVSGINGFGRRTVRTRLAHTEAAEGHFKRGPHIMST